MPGGGFGQFDGCTTEWNATTAVWGAEYGGPSTDTCSDFPTALQPGCDFRWGWMQGTSNPTYAHPFPLPLQSIVFLLTLQSVDYEVVTCPAEIVAKSGCSVSGYEAPASSSSSTVEALAVTSSSLPSSSSSAVQESAATSPSSSSSLVVYAPSTLSTIVSTAALSSVDAGPTAHSSPVATVSASVASLSASAVGLNVTSTEGSSPIGSTGRPHHPHDSQHHHWTPPKEEEEDDECEA